MPLLPMIQRYVDQEILSLDEAKSLTVKQRRSVGSHSIYQLVVEKKISVSNALQLNTFQCSVFENMHINRLISHGKLTIDAALCLTADQYSLLDNNLIGQLIIFDKITLKQALEFTHHQRSILTGHIFWTDNGLVDIIIAGKLDMQEALQLTLDNYHALENKEIQTLILAEKISVAHVLTLNWFQQGILRGSGVHHLIVTNKLSIEQALKLNSKQCEILNTYMISELIRSEKISIDQALSFTHLQRCTLTYRPSYSRLMDGTMTLEQALQLTIEQRRDQVNPPAPFGLPLTRQIGKRGPDTHEEDEAKRQEMISGLIAAQILTEEKASQLSWSQRWTLSSPVIYELLLIKMISLEKVLQMDDIQRVHLGMDAMYELLVNQTITIEQFLQSDARKISVLCNHVVCELFTSGKMTLADVMQIDTNGLQAIKDHNIRELIAAGIITLAQISQNLTDAQYAHLRNTAIQHLLLSRKISIEQVMQARPAANIAVMQTRPVSELIDANIMTSEQAFQLTYPCYYHYIQQQTIHECLMNRTLTMLQVLRLTVVQNSVLNSVPIDEFISAGLLTLEQALQLTAVQLKSLETEEILDLIASRTITLTQALQLTDHQQSALEDIPTRQRLKNGTLTFAVFMGDDPDVGDAIQINDSQSTHNAKINVSVALSAKQLYIRYYAMPPQISAKQFNLEAKIAQDISAARDYVFSLPNNSEKNKAAKRCIDRISRWVYNEPISGVSLRSLLALSFLAISDAMHRVGSLEYARRQFIEGLYEIQRGYNLSSLGFDRGGNDDPICAPGTFSKLIEKLQSIHPDCEFKYATRSTASLKFPRVVREEGMRYLSSLSDPKTASELHAFRELLAKVESEGIEIIWDKIKDSIAERIFEEFGSLFKNQFDPDFIGMIDAGQYQSLGDLSCFQQQVQQSLGYQDYCSQLLRQRLEPIRQRLEPTFFAPDSAIWARRHHSEVDQNEHDKCYGLVPLAKKARYEP